MPTFMITSVNSIAPLFTLGGLCPTRNGRIHDLSPTVTRQLVKTYKITPAAIITNSLVRWYTEQKSLPKIYKILCQYLCIKTGFEIKKRFELDSDWSTYWPSGMADSYHGDRVPHTCVDHMEVSYHKSNYNHVLLTEKKNPMNFTSIIYRNTRTCIWKFISAQTMITLDKCLRISSEWH